MTHPAPRIIGHVRSPLASRQECPKYGDPSLPPVWIDLDPQYAPAAENLNIGDAVLVLTWLHLADQSVLRCHPKGNTDLPMRGIFSTRSPTAPTPIGLHAVRITDRKTSIQVHPRRPCTARQSRHQARHGRAGRSGISHADRS